MKKEESVSTNTPFKKGDKVRCIISDEEHLIKGNTYTVNKFGMNRHWQDKIEVEGIDAEFFPQRFEKILTPFHRKDKL